MKKILLYVLHSGNLYGTERMALVTLDGLREQWLPVLLAPPGPVHVAAQELGIEAVVFNGKKDLLRAMYKHIQNADDIAFCATGVLHSLVFVWCNSLFRRPFVHVHLVHGGTDERDSYGRKKWLNHFTVKLVAVSEFVKQRLLAHGVVEGNIQVIENFLPTAQITEAPARKAFSEPGVDKVIVVSRVDPIKRLDVLMDALDKAPDLSHLDIRILGTGWELDVMRERAAKSHPKVNFVGFSSQVAEELTAADLLLHLCPTEPFGLAILEAMAARIPVLLPDQGGAAGLIEDNISGYRFQANDVDALIAQLRHLQKASADELNDRVEHAYQRLNRHYSSTVRLDDYQNLFAGKNDE